MHIQLWLCEWVVNLHSHLVTPSLDCKPESTSGNLLPSLLLLSRVKDDLNLNLLNLHINTYIIKSISLDYEYFNKSNYFVY